MASTTTDKFASLCIPRAMLFHKADFVEKAINIAMLSTSESAFVKSIESKTTKDKEGKEFNVFFITPNQEFEENQATRLVYQKLSADGVVNISTGSKGFFWKVKLYIPNLKAKHTEKVAKKPEAPKIMSDEDTEAYRLWREKRLAAKAAKAKAAEAKGPWDSEDGEIFEE
jgi:hypothetical protein